MMHSPGIFCFRQADGYIANLYPEFVALVSGLKPVIRTAPVTSSDSERLRALALRLGLFTTRRINHPDKDSCIVYVSKRYDSALKAKYFEQGRDSIRLGKLLGYPACCINAFMGHTRSRHLKEDTEPYNACINTLKKGGEFNGLLKIGVGYHLISHFPCRYDCKLSVAYADKLLNAIMKACKDKMWLAGLLNHLNSPVLKVYDFYYDLYSLKIRSGQNSIYNIGHHKIRPFEKASSAFIHLNPESGRRSVRKVSLFKLFSLYDIICEYDKNGERQKFSAVSLVDKRRCRILEKGPDFYFLPFRFKKKNISKHRA